jgi:NADH-quinone oxidoreductase subunit C
MSWVEVTAGRIRERVHEGLLDARTELGTDVLVVAAEQLPDVMRFLRDEEGFDLLLDVSATDWLPREPRYDVNYHLLGVEHGHRVRVKVQLPDVEEPSVPSVTGIWAGAACHERETWDFFGIRFEGHPNLNRVFMPDEWIGHPLRKDYPVGGVPVEYRIEPAYVGDRIVSAQGLPAAGGVPARIHRDRGRLSPMSWTGPPAAGIGHPEAGLKDEAAIDEEGT